MRKLLLATTISFLSLAPLAAQGPSWTSFGQGCGGSGGVPFLQALTLPRIDTDFCLEISSGLPIVLPFAGPGLFAWVFGFNNTDWMGFQLPYDLVNFDTDFSGCVAYVAVEHVFPAFHSGIGTVKFTVRVPNDASLAGVHFWNQAAFLDLTGAALADRPLAVSNAGEGIIDF